MKPQDFAAALYRAVRGRGKKEIEAGVQGLVAALKTRGSVRLLPQILAELPKAIAEADAANRVTVETARELDAKSLEQIVRSAGVDPDKADVQQVVRPELIGGARIKKHGITIDASVKGKLARVRAALARRAA